MTRSQLIYLRLQVYAQAVADGATPEEAKEFAIYVTRSRKVAQITQAGLRTGR